MRSHTRQGLVGFTFSPSFHTTGLFYVSYSVPGSGGEWAANRLSKMVYDPSSPEDTLASEEILITTSDKLSTLHSGGWVGFKPSAYAEPTATFHDLYWSIGDGGPQNDLSDRGQDVDEYHGSIVRISVPSTAGASGYEIPIDNPFASGGLGEICAYGFRNPFRCSFDTETDELYCGDVGHESIESVDLVECGNNYGWRRFEGDRCSEQIEDEFPEPCETVDRSPFTFPVYQYCHTDYIPQNESAYLVDQDICGDRTMDGGAIIGGYVYRGAKYNGLLTGHYIFADYNLWNLKHLIPSGEGWDYGTITDDDVPTIISFSQDNN
ncbi:unnamed protein product, partial [Sphacelaria rigidula]